MNTIPMGCFLDRVQLYARGDAYSRQFVRPMIVVLIAVFPLLNQNFPTTLRPLLFVVACAVGFRSVYTTFLVLAASVVIPDQGFGPFTATHVALLMWGASWFLWQRDRRFCLPRSGSALLYVLGVWLTITALLTSDTAMLFEFLKAVAVGMIAYHMLSLDNVRPELCLLSMVLGTALAAMPWYFESVLHLPGFVNRSNIVFYNIRSGGFRYAIAKQDPNAITILLNVMSWGALNLGLRARSFALPFSGWWLVLLATLAFPPLVAADSRTGYLVFLLAAFVTGALWLATQPGVLTSLVRYRVSLRVASGRRTPALATLVLVALLIAALLIGAERYAGPEWYDRIATTFTVLAERRLDDREDRFSEAWAVISASPVFGVGIDGYQNIPGFVNVPHNTFLDMGIAGGVPGMIAFALAVFWPAAQCLIRLKRIHASTVVGLVCYVVILGEMMSLSMVGDKLFWILWAFLVLAAEQTANGKDGWSAVVSGPKETVRGIGGSLTTFELRSDHGPDEAGRLASDPEPRGRRLECRP